MAFNDRRAHPAGNTNDQNRRAKAIKAQGVRSKAWGNGHGHRCQAWLHKQGRQCNNAAESWHRFCGTHSHYRVKPQRNGPDTTVKANTPIHKGPRLSLADAIERAKQIEHDA